MDRETTQRLLKESIIFLCRTYIGVVSDFEVDGIICISHDDGVSDQQHVVFKIHELVSREADARATYADGPELDFEGSGSLRASGPWRRSGAKRRKLGNYSSSHKNNKKNDNQLNYANSIPVFPELKLESPWPDELIKSNHDTVAIGKGDFANVYRNKQIDNGDELPKYSCCGCELSCPTKKILDKHMLSVHELSTYCFCKTCGVGFIGTDDFDMHNVLVHTGCNDVAGVMEGDDDSDTANRPESNSPQADDFRNIISSSAIFPIASKNHQVARNCRPSSSIRISSASSMHVASETLDTNAAVLSSLPEENPESEDAIIDQSAPRACSLCDSGFSDFPTFNIHCKEAHNIFACPYCRKTFIQQAERDNHLFKHTGEKPFECPDCTLRFSRLDSLRRHRMKIHGLSWTDIVLPDSDSRPADNPSDDFDAVNDGRRSLENHIVSLTGVHPGSNSWMDGGSDAGERLFEVARSYPGSCQSSDAIEISDDESCSRSARSRYRNIKTLDPDRTFVCEICRETIQGTAAFRDHCDTTHRRVPCPYCGGTFTQKASMERHQRQHTGERPFRCQFCEHTYTRKENLQTHMLRLHPLLLDAE